MGVGSYVIYRMFVRLLGRNFLWRIIDQVRLDLLNLSRQELYLLHSTQVFFIFIFSLVNKILKFLFFIKFMSLHVGDLMVIAFI